MAGDGLEFYRVLQCPDHSVPSGRLVGPMMFLLAWSVVLLLVRALLLFLPLSLHVFVYKYALQGRSENRPVDLLTGFSPAHPTNATASNLCFDSFRHAVYLQHDAIFLLMRGPCW